MHVVLGNIYSLAAGEETVKFLKAKQLSACEDPTGMNCIDIE